MKKRSQVELNDVPNCRYRSDALQHSQCVCIPLNESDIGSNHFISMQGRVQKNTLEANFFQDFCAMNIFIQGDGTKLFLHYISQ